MLSNIYILVCLFAITFSLSCKSDKKTSKEEPITVETVSEASKPTEAIAVVVAQPEGIIAPKGMVWITGGTFLQGAVPQDKFAMSHEKPAHKVSVDGFFMDITEVTNAQFKIFVDATGYKTLAEKAPDWEEMKKQLPAGTQKPHDSILQAGSLTFKKTKTAVTNLYDFSQWWKWTYGANWQKPDGPDSSIKGKDNHPVVHISYEDAVAYCNWADRRLPTEAEWEIAAKGNDKKAIYFWGNDESVLTKMANTWEGQFPVTNTKTDGFEKRAPVKSYPPNDFGLYDMAGNVWEWTSDWYNTKYYQTLLHKNVKNPLGAENPFNQHDPYAREKIMKGGSFLCNASYCASYRVSSRMATSLDSSLEHLGFRTVVTVEMIKTKQQ